MVGLTYFNLNPNCMQRMESRNWLRDLTQMDNKSRVCISDFNEFYLQMRSGGGIRSSKLFDLEFSKCFDRL